MNEYALLINNEFKEIRMYEGKPVDIPHKQVTWHDVVREVGAIAFTGLENNNWVIRTAAPSLSTVKERKIAQAASIRWEKEIGGTVYDGYPLATDSVSQTKYIGAVVGMQLNPASIITWKMADGTFVELDANAMIAVATAVRNHVQSCFDNEAILVDAINAANTVAQVEAIDLNIGWPANS